MIKIVERLENNEHVFELVVDEKVVCTAKTLDYKVLEVIDCVPSEKRKGYATRLLKGIEEIAKQNGIKVITTSDIDSKDIAATSFFKSMGYTLEPIENNEEFLEGKKNLEIASEKKTRILDPKLAILRYLFEFRHIGVKEKYPYISLKCIAEACNSSLWKTDRILEYLRRGKLVERSFRRAAPPNEIFFQITEKGIRLLYEKQLIQK